MSDFIPRLLVIMIGTALVTYVLTRAGNYPPARFFVIVTIIVTWLSISNVLIEFATSEGTVLWLTQSNMLMLGLLPIALLLLFSLLFTPKWWHGSKPIRWIVLPYILANGLILLDLLLGTGLIINGYEVSGGEMRLLRGSAGMSLLILYTLSWLVPVGVLINGFIALPRQRIAIVLLVSTLLISAAIGILAGNIPAIAPFQSLLNAVPFIGALAYLVLRTHLLVPTTAAFDLAVAAIGDAILVLDLDGQIIYVNPAAAQLGLMSGRPLNVALEATDASKALARQLGTPGKQRTVEIPATLAGRKLLFSAVLVADQQGRQVGVLILGRDVTELEQRSNHLEAERVRLAATVAQLEAEQGERARLAETVRNLTLPVIPVLRGVLVVPLVTAIDARVAEELSETVLKGIERDQARLVLLDITGLPLLDTTGAMAIIRAVQAARLLGARCVLVGVRPEVAQTLVAQGVDLGDISTAATLQHAVEHAIMSKGVRSDYPLRLA